MQMAKFVERAQAFVGEDGAVDTVSVVQKRPPLAIAAGAAAFIVVALLLNLIGISNIILVGGLGGAALAGAMTALTTNYYLAGVGDEVRMLRLGTWSGKPEGIEKTLSRPLGAAVSGGLINKGVELDGTKYVLGRPFITEFESLNAAPAKN